MIKTRVAGTVILYNPDLDIMERIASYIRQVEIIYVVDNSEQVDSEMEVRLKSFNKKIEYTKFDKNLGVAYALNFAAMKAIEEGYDFLLTMDQDSKAPVNLVETLLKTAHSYQNVGIVSPLHSNKFNTHLTAKKDKREVVSVMTSGNLLSLSAFKTVGGFRDDFFIDYVDVEYCLRLNYNSFKVVQVNNAVLEHNEANLTEKKFIFKKYYPSNNPPFRLYYKTRNLLYLRKSYKKKYPYPLRKEYKIFFRNLAKILLLEKYKYLKFRMILLGIWDYFKRKSGRKS